jgi:hypothetical protein
MITEYNNNIDNNVKEYWAANGHLFPDKGIGYQENPAWGLAKTLTKERPFTPSDFEKKYFIRDF